MVFSSGIFLIMKGYVIGWYYITYLTSDDNAVKISFFLNVSVKYFHKYEMIVPYEHRITHRNSTWLTTKVTIHSRFWVTIDLHIINPVWTNTVTHDTNLLTSTLCYMYAWIRLTFFTNYWQNVVKSHLKVCKYWYDISNLRLWQTKSA